MDTNDQIVGWVREIDRLHAEKEDLWRNIRKCIDGGRVDDAVSLLNRFFSMKERIERVQVELIGTLKAQLADK